LVVALELSGKTWEVGAVVPAVSRRPRQRLSPRDMAGLLARLDKWRAEAPILPPFYPLPVPGGRNGPAYGFDLRGRPRRVLDRALFAGSGDRSPDRAPGEYSGRTQEPARENRPNRPRHVAAHVLAWLRGEPRVCSMVRIPDAAEEDMRSLPCEGATRSANANDW
jgi:transposase